LPDEIGHVGQFPPAGQGLDQHRKGPLALAQDDGVHLRNLEITRNQGHVMAADHGEGLRSEQLDLAENLASGVHFGRQGRHRHHLRSEGRYRAPQIRIDSHIKDTDVVITDGCRDHLQRQRLGHGGQPKAYVRRITVGLNK